MDLKQIRRPFKAKWRIWCRSLSGNLTQKRKQDFRTEWSKPLWVRNCTDVSGVTRQTSVASCPESVEYGLEWIEANKKQRNEQKATIDTQVHGRAPSAAKSQCRKGKKGKRCKNPCRSEDPKVTHQLLRSVARVLAEQDLGRCVSGRQKSLC